MKTKLVLLVRVQEKGRCTVEERFNTLLYLRRTNQLFLLTCILKASTRVLSRRVCGPMTRKPLLQTSGNIAGRGSMTRM